MGIEEVRSPHCTGDEVVGLTGTVVIEVVGLVEVLKVDDVQSTQAYEVVTSATFVS